MILTISDLPSNGKFGTAPPLRLRPLTFLEVIEYTSEVTGNTVKNYIRDIKWLRKLDENVVHHSLYDLQYLIFMMKVHTISDNRSFQSEVSCPNCGNRDAVSFDLGDFNFRDLSDKDKLPTKVELGGFKYDVKVPTISTFLEVLNKYALYKKSDNVDVVKLISLFPEFASSPNDIENAVLNATRKDISILYLLEVSYLNSMEPLKKICTKCKNEGGMMIGISSLIIDMFRDILFNSHIDEDEVQSM